MTTVTFDVDLGDLDAFAALLGLPNAQHPDFAPRLAALAKHAFAERADWLTGRDRPGQTGELDRRRVLHLFATVRNQAVTVERLVDELGFPETRAKTLISRLRYSDAKTLRGLAIRAAHDDLQARHAAAEPDENSRRTVYLPRETFLAVREAESALILAGPADDVRAIDTTGRLSAIGATTTDGMWGLVMDWLDTTATSLGA
ncbi:MAG TPA: hypothetical protein VHF89_17035 [Solirubrobacteraceae bacterium]|nr:hypothetical protein [Solirubrobacteraceae bacterium]